MPSTTSVLTGPDGAIEVSNAELSTEVNVGWRWSCELPAEHATDFARLAGFRLDISDGRGFAVSSPALVCLERESADNYNADGGGSAKLSGTCLTSHLLARRNYSTATFRSTSAVAIANFLAAAAGVLLRLPPALADFPVPDEDVKQAQLAEALGRLLDKQPAQWYVDSNGLVQVVMWGDAGGMSLFEWSNARRATRPELRFTKRLFAKRSAYQGNNQDGSGEYPFGDAGFKSFALQAPLNNAVPADLSTIGEIDWVTFWDGDPTSSGKAIAYHQFNQLNSLPNLGVVFSGTWPATHVTCVCFPPQGLSGVLPGLDPTSGAWLLKVTGTPPGDAPAADAAFTHLVDLGDTPPWPAEDDVDSLWPNKAWLQARGNKLLAMGNSGWDTLTLDGPLDCAADLFQTFTYKGDAFKTRKITWRAGDNPETAIELVRHE